MNLWNKMCTLCKVMVHIEMLSIFVAIVVSTGATLTVPIGTIVTW